MARYKDLTPNERKILDQIHEYIEQRALAEIGEFFAMMYSDDKKKKRLKRLLSVQDSGHGSVLEHAFKVAKADFDAELAYRERLHKKHLH